MKSLSIIITLSLLFLSCSKSGEKKNTSKYTDEATTLYSIITPEESNIHFKNTVIETMEFNFLNYPYIYTCAGVAVGDIDNDGLQYVYFVSNFGPNKLFKNIRISYF